jgi:hypothetical protein
VLLRVAATLVGLLALGSPPAAAQEESVEPEAPPVVIDGGAGHGTRSVRLGWFDVDDQGQGNPFLDESLTVIEPVLIYDYNITDRTALSTQFSYDNVSSASIERLRKFPGQSGASGDYYFGLDLGLRHAVDENTLRSGRFHASAEYDYTSFGLGAGETRQSRDRNSSWTWSLDGFYDIIDIIRFDGAQNEGTDDRLSLTANLSFYQVVTPRSHTEFGLTAAIQSGFLETAYNAVVVEDPSLPPNPNLANMARGTEFSEELPDSRIRTAIYGRWKTLVAERTAVQLEGRVYDDDWGIQSFNLEPRLYQDLWSEEWRLRLRLRYYDQSASDYFRDSFTDLPELRTQDSDLGAFHSLTYGAKLIWSPSEDVHYDLGFDLIDRSDGLDQAVLSVGFTESF